MADVATLPQRSQVESLSSRGWRKNLGFEPHLPMLEPQLLPITLHCICHRRIVSRKKGCSHYCTNPILICPDGSVPINYWLLRTPFYRDNQTILRIAAINPWLPWSIQSIRNFMHSFFFFFPLHDNLLK